MKKMIFLGIISILLSGCMSSSQENPVGIGMGPNKLKKSPCACIELPNYANEEQKVILS